MLIMADFRMMMIIMDDPAQHDYYDDEPTATMITDHYHERGVMPMKIIEKDEVRKLLPAGECVDLMKQALAGLETGKNGQPPRLITIMPNTAKFGFMPAYVGSDYFGAKVITAYEPNMGTEYPSHIGYIMLFESKHCTVAALVEAGTITEIRTGAVSAVATDLLARKDSHRLALIGTGAQARSYAGNIRSA